MKTKAFYRKVRKQQVISAIYPERQNALLNHVHLFESTNFLDLFNEIKRNCVQIELLFAL